jgi:hypothetical protein
MHRIAFVSQVHRMGRVTKTETFKEPPLVEVRALTGSPYTNRSIEISLMLGRYQGDIPSIDFARPRG